MVGGFLILALWLMKISSILTITPSEQCGENCESCRIILGEIECYDCKEGFKLEDFGCTPCSLEGCGSCNEFINLCSHCRDGYFNSSLQGEAGFTYVTKCSGCVVGCRKCSNDKVCEECMGHYKINGDKNCTLRNINFIYAAGGIGGMALICILLYVIKKLGLFRFCFSKGTVEEQARAKSLLGILSNSSKSGQRKIGEEAKSKSKSMKSQNFEFSEKGDVKNKKKLKKKKKKKQKKKLNKSGDEQLEIEVSGFKSYNNRGQDGVLEASRFSVPTPKMKERQIEVQFNDKNNMKLHVSQGVSKYQRSEKRAALNRVKENEPEEEKREEDKKVETHPELDTNQKDDLVKDKQAQLQSQPPADENKPVVKGFIFQIKKKPKKQATEINPSN